MDGVLHNVFWDSGAVLSWQSLWRIELGEWHLSATLFVAGAHFNGLLRCKVVSILLFSLVFKICRLWKLWCCIVKALHLSGGIHSMTSWYNSLVCRDKPKITILFVFDLETLYRNYWWNGMKSPFACWQMAQEIVCWLLSIHVYSLASYAPLIAVELFELLLDDLCWAKSCERSSRQWKLLEVLSESNIVLLGVR